MKSKIFISYRRDDSAGYAGRLYDRLRQHFGRDSIFMDVDTIEPGVDFAEVIERSIGSCDVFITLIGTRWVTATDDTGKRRLDDPDDYVRLEIVSALERNIRVIPVLVNGAPVPALHELPDDLKPLRRRNAIKVDHERFDTDAKRLVQAIERALEQLEAKRLSETDNLAQNQREIEGKQKPIEIIETQKKSADRIQTERQKTENEQLITASTKHLWRILLQSTIIWAIGGTLGFLFLILVNLGVVFYESWFYVTISGAIGGFVLGVELRHTEPSNWWIQLFISALGVGIILPIITSFFGSSDDLADPIGAITAISITGMLYYWLRIRAWRKA
jgi:hypothetical protein